MTADGRLSVATPPAPANGNEDARQPDVGLAVVHVVTLRDVSIEPVCWLWQNYLPLGKLVVLDGLPGQGKSTLLIDIAARLSVGAAMPDGTPGHSAPCDTLILTYEDDPQDTLKPRLIAAGGDAARVHVVVGVSYNGDLEPLPAQLPKDIAALGAELEARPDVKLVVIDPFAAAISADVDSHRDQDVRRPLARLARMAAELNICIVIIRHVKKSHGGNAISAGGGSIGIIGQARVGLLVDRHPEDPDAAVLAVAKSNVGPLAPSLTFRKVTAVVRSPSGESIITSRLEWVGISPLSADELLSSRDDGTIDEGRDATDWIRQVLDNGRMERKAVIDAARAAGFPERTIDRAAKRAGVAKERTGFGADCRSYWSLPTSATTPAKQRHTAGVAEVDEVAEVAGFGGNQLCEPGSPEERALLARLEHEEGR